MDKKIKIIGIAGKSCSGKNLLASLLREEYDFFEVDLDLLAHEALEEEVETVQKMLKVKIPWIKKISLDGKKKQELDRRTLAKEVFKNPKKLKQLESLLYPIMDKKIHNLLLEKEKISLNGAKLLESKWITSCDLILWIQAPLFSRIFRGKKRDHLPLKALLRRFWSQRKLSPQPFKKIADIKTVYNYGSEEKVKKQIQRLFT